jgi:ABC-type glycerol-3-phosphate transport system substrate-binding protein
MKRTLSKGLCLILVVTTMMILSVGFGPNIIEAKTNTLRIGAEGWIVQKFKMQEAAEKFMADHPGVKVQIIKYENTDYTSNVLQWSQGKTSVDIAIGGSREQAVQYVAKNLIINFDTGFYDNKVKKKDFIPSLLELGNIKGKQYMIPLMGEVECIVVRKDLMAKEGLTDSKGNVIPPKTWNELYNYAKKLTKIQDGRVVQTGLAIDWGYDFMTYNYLASLQGMKGSYLEKGSKKIDFVSSQAKYLLTMWAKLVKEKCSPIDTFSDSDANRTNFKAGRVAMQITAHSRWPEYVKLLGGDKVTVIPLPGADRNGSIVYIHGMVIPKASPVKNLAKRFIKERLMDKDFQVWTLENYGKMPVLEKNFQGATSPKWKQILEWAVNAKTSPLYKDWAKMDRQIQVEFQNGITGMQSIEETLKNLKAKIDSIDITTGLK